VKRGSGLRFKQRVDAHAEETIAHHGGEGRNCPMVQAARLDAAARRAGFGAGALDPLVAEIADALGAGFEELRPLPRWWRDGGSNAARATRAGTLHLFRPPRPNGGSSARRIDRNVPPPATRHRRSPSHL
jgi:hypothetical protein